VLGLICQYNGTKLGSSSWEDELQNEDELLIETKDVGWDNCGPAVYRIFCKFLLKDDAAIKSAASKFSPEHGSSRIRAILSFSPSAFQLFIVMKFVLLVDCSLLIHDLC